MNRPPMSSDTFIGLLLVLAFVTFVGITLRSELRDTQRRIATLEQRCK